MREVSVYVFVFFGFRKFQILGEEEKGNPKVLSFMEVEGGGRRRQRERERESDCDA